MPPMAGKESPDEILEKNMHPAVIADNVYKKYARSSKNVLGYGFSDLIHELTGRQKNSSLRPDEFWACEGLSFAVNPGDSLGILGRNGSGKTTMLRMLAGLIKPDAGSIMVCGRVQALIALGAGFNPRLSGRENLFNAAALMGLSRKETLEIVEEVVAFSELEDFIDSPVENYSSGMYARLGFSVAVHLRPEILFIDEILSVGDVAFQNKCFIKMHAMKKAGTTIVLVSHNLTQIAQLCDRALWLHHGKEMKIGPCKQVIENYLAFLGEEERRRVEKLNAVREEGLKAPKKSSTESIYGGIFDEFTNISDLEVQFLVDGQEVESLELHANVTIRYSFTLKVPVKALNVSLGIWRKDGLLMSTISTLVGDHLAHVRSGRVVCEVCIPDFQINPGEYVLVMPIHEGHSYLYRNIVKEFVVVGSKQMTWGLLTPRYEYKVLSP